MRRLRIIALLTLVYTAGAMADISIRYDAVNSNQKNPLHSVNIKQDLVRIDHLIGQQPWIMVDTQNGDIVQINPASKRFFRTNAKTLAQYVDLYRQNKGWMNGLITQGIQHLQPAQRAQIEQLMTRMEQPTNQQETLIQKTHISDQVLGVNCRVYRIMEQGIHAQDICLSRYQDIAISANDVNGIERLKRLIQYLKQASPGSQQDVISLLAEAIGNLDGIPMKVIHYHRNGKVRQVIEAGAISLRKVPATNYRIPNGFQEQMTPLL